MNTKLRKVSLGIALAGTLVSFTVQDTYTAVEVNDTITATNLAANKVIEIKSSQPVDLPIGSIHQVHEFEMNEEGGGFRCITTKSVTATDVGPYSELYFLFDNAYEMPHRSAMFKIGNLASISDFKKLAPNKYEVTGWLFENGDYYAENKVSITIDASNVIAKEASYDKEDSDYEGEISAKVIVTIKAI